jgi:heme/copper-type cytochrome/quinol oxidase subunit 2
MRGQLTVLSTADYEAWVEQSSQLARRAYDPEDKSGHWAWSWERGVK